MKEINWKNGAIVSHYIRSSRGVKKILPFIEVMDVFSRSAYEHRNPPVSLDVLLRNGLAKTVRTTPIKTSTIRETIIVNNKTNSRICSLKEWELMSEEVKKLFGNNVHSKTITRKTSWGKKNLYMFNKDEMQDWLIINDENVRKYFNMKIHNLEIEKSKNEEELRKFNESI